MSTSIRITNLAKNGGHAIIVRPDHDGPIASKPTVINPGEEHEFNVAEQVALRVQEDNGISNS